MAAMAKEVSADGRRGEHVNPNLTSDEFAFSDAGAQNSPVILWSHCDTDVTMDWVSGDDRRATLRGSITRLLAKHGYPPDVELEAIQLVFTRWEIFAQEWSARAEG